MPWIENAGLATPWFFVGLFLAASFLMVWRLESMAADGMEGTVLGTLIMPYCTGMGNLIFTIVLGMRGGSGADVMTNCLVNNVTNLTLLVGLPAALWGMSVITEKKVANRSHRLNRLAMLLTLFAVLFFTVTAWAMERHGEIGVAGGLVLIGLFLCWQAFHIFALLKTNRLEHKSFPRMLPVDLILLAAGAYATWLSTDWLVAWVSNIKTGGLISARYLGWLSGWLDVLPNGVLAFYYGWRRKAEVVYTSQVGDGHICIPLCLGMFALYQPLKAPQGYQAGMIILLAAVLVHLVFIGMLGRLPRMIGWLLTAAYALFLYEGFGK